MRGLLGAILVSVFLTIPLTIWFVDISRRRGRSILQERHERGAMLVERELLLAEVSQHNQAAFRKGSPGVPARPLAAAGAATALCGAQGRRDPPSLHTRRHPVPAPDGTVAHDAGRHHRSGKTTELRSLVKQMRERQDSAVIFDLTGAYVEAFYDPEPIRSSIRWTGAARMVDLFGLLHPQ
ncbi:type IV secretion system DNA-binding domain-containing protein [Roseomonas aeriglobus]|nr:type IV secretion system DNA-binding domain-containing protein [Roseomonas aeriglobus]